MLAAKPKRSPPSRCVAAHVFPLCCHTSRLPPASRHSPSVPHPAATAALGFAARPLQLSVNSPSQPTTTRREPVLLNGFNFTSSHRMATRSSCVPRGGKPWRTSVATGSRPFRGRGGRLRPGLAVRPARRRPPGPCHAPQTWSCPHSVSSARRQQQQSRLGCRAQGRCRSSCHRRR